MPFDINDFNDQFKESQKAQIAYFEKFNAFQSMMNRLEQYIKHDHFKEDQRPYDPNERLKEERDLYREQLLELNRLIEDNNKIRKIIENIPNLARTHELACDSRVKKMMEVLSEKARELKLTPPFDPDEYLSDIQKRLAAMKVKPELD